MNKALVLVDGENLATRFRDVADGEKVDPRVVRDGELLWHKDLSPINSLQVLRVSYFTTAVGSDEKIRDLEKRISVTDYAHRDGQGTLCPHVFRKLRDSRKTRLVDLGIAIDALRHTYNRTVDHVVLLSGDGDFVPLIREIMGQGVQVTSGAFSSGLNKELEVVADESERGN